MGWESKMIGWLFVILILAILHYNRPDRRSFEDYYHGSRSKLVRWVGRLVMPPYEYLDMLVFAMVTLEDGHIFVGILGTWLTVTAPPKVEQAPAENAQLKKAVRLKGEKRFAEAYQAFVKAARSAVNDLEEADCWAEAAKCAKVVGEITDFYQGRAAECYLKAGRTLRAANLYESMGNLETAIKLYESVGDGRSETLQADLADGLAQAGRWSEAQQAWRRAAEHAKGDPLLTPLARRRMMLAGLCAIANGETPCIPAWLEETPEAMVLRGTGNSEHLIAKMAKLPDWATEIIDRDSIL